MLRAGLALAVWSVLAGAPPAAAQGDLNLGTPQVVAPDAMRSPVLTVDPEALFEGSLFGRRLIEDIRAETEALAAENRRIEAELTAEEQELTDRRPDMDVEAFRAEAEDFDAKVQMIRRQQDAKERDLERLETESRDRFLVAAQPILGRMMLQRGAVVMLDRRSVFLGFGAIDVTDAAIAEIDAELGDGSALENRDGPVPQNLDAEPDR